MSSMPRLCQPAQISTHYRTYWSRSILKYLSPEFIHDIAWERYLEHNFMVFQYNFEDPKTSHVVCIKIKCFRSRCRLEENRSRSRHKGSAVLCGRLLDMLSASIKYGDEGRHTSVALSSLLCIKLDLQGLQSREDKEGCALACIMSSQSLLMIFSGTGISSSNWSSPRTTCRVKFLLLLSRL